MKVVKSLKSWPEIIHSVHSNEMHRETRRGVPVLVVQYFSFNHWGFP